MGELCIQPKPSIVATVRGFCVSVTLFNMRLAMGVICHALLPLNRAGHPIAVQDVRETNGRKILFHTHTGAIYLKHLGLRERSALNMTGAKT